MYNIKVRLDHIAYRTKNRYKTAKFFEDCLGYSIGTEFQITFDDGSKADCLALVPPEERPTDTSRWKYFALHNSVTQVTTECEYHSPPEIFVSDGAEGSIVGDWVKEKGGVGGVHHVAYQVRDVKAAMKEWQEKGYAEFLSEEPLKCPGLEQVFTKPSELTGVIYELISRTDRGFCEVNVKGLMESTKEL